jgi:hypothetical protein
MSDIQIIDNFLPKKEFMQLQGLMMSHHIPWNYSDAVVGPTADWLGEKRGTTNDNYDFQFTHCFYMDNEWLPHAKDTYQILGPTLQLLDPACLVRIKANLVPRTPEKVTHGFHVDHEHLLDKMKIAVLYINTNNGQTLFKNGQSVDSVANRIVIFNGDMLHSGTTTTNRKVRCVINFNYISRS